MNPDDQRAEMILAESLRLKRIATDRQFVWIFIIQWIIAIAITFVVSPFSWEGNSRSPHLHLEAALIVGGLINVVPLALVYFFPGRWFTRHVVTIAQMLWSALLIHLTGGRIETHFHIFVSLAFLAFYLDRSVFISATLLVVADHLFRGFYWPESIYGTANPEWWRFLEHASWVIFEDIVLILGCSRSLAEMRLDAKREALLENINFDIENKIRLRTQELTTANKSLADEIEARLKMEAELVDVSRRAGMAEVATSVLHNVGNVLNSVNVSATVAVDQLRHSKIGNLARIAAMFTERTTDLGAFLTNDPKGSQIPGYLGRLSERLVSDRDTVVRELESLRQNIEHIKGIVAMQQSYAKVSGVIETVRPADLVEDALRMNGEGPGRSNISLLREYDEAAVSVDTERHKVLQILINLIRNAEKACDESGVGNKIIVLRVAARKNHVQVSVIDNGVGISKENLTRIFQHGFTTRKNGHGFGLHSGVLAARELGGSLTVCSEGLGKGAAFTLELPLKRKAHDANERPSDSPVGGTPAPDEEGLTKELLRIESAPREEAVSLAKGR